MMMRIVRLKPYRRAMSRMGVDEEGMRQVEIAIAAAPESNPVLRGLRGVRKARFALPGEARAAAVARSTILQWVKPYT
jgi:anti-sigma factor RsiW